MERPDLSDYLHLFLLISNFSKAVLRHQNQAKQPVINQLPSGEITYQEAPGPVNILTFSQAGAVKRTHAICFHAASRRNGHI
jgi:hypothetical protein